MKVDINNVLQPLEIRRKLGKRFWGVPLPCGPNSWMFLSVLGKIKGCIIISADIEEDGVAYIHASISRPQMPTYEDLKMLHETIFPGFAYQVFAPSESHVNIHERALHLWGRVDGKPWMPDFGRYGTI